MREDRTGWLVVFDGTIYGAWGRYMLPPRNQNPSELWRLKKRIRVRTPANPKQSPLERGENGKQNDIE